MKTKIAMILGLAVPTIAAAEDMRQLDAHEHGVGTLDIAIDGDTLAMMFRAPGADIVGFEYVATSDADRAAVATALDALSDPLTLFVPPAGAACRVVQAEATLISGDDDDDHDDHDDDHDDHDDDHGDDHDDDHDDDHHADDHAEHADHSADDHDAGHTEFQASYTLECGTMAALSDLTFAYFEAFPNAQEVEIQLLSASGARAAEVDREDPILSIAD